MKEVPANNAYSAQNNVFSHSFRLQRCQTSMRTKWPFTFDISNHNLRVVHSSIKRWHLFLLLCIIYIILGKLSSGDNAWVEQCQWLPLKMQLILEKYITISSLPYKVPIMILESTFLPLFLLSCLWKKKHRA